MTVNTLTLYMPGSSVGIQVYEGSQLHLILVSQGANSIPSAPGQTVRKDPFPQYVDDDELAAALAGVGGGGAVDSVNGQIGAVVLDAADIAGFAAVATSGSYDDLTDQPTIPSAYTDEQVRDVIGAALTPGTGITITPDDNGDTIVIGATGGGSGGATTTRRLMVVASNGWAVGGVSTAQATASTSRKVHTLAVNASDLRLAYVNILTSTGADADGPGQYPIKSSLQIGTQIYRMPFGGQRTLGLDPGGLAVTDPLAVEANAQSHVYSRTYINSTAWRPNTATYNGWTGGVAAGDLTEPGAAAVGDSNSYQYAPAAVLGVPADPAARAVLVVGDSISIGIGDEPGTGGGGSLTDGTSGGFISRALFGKAGWVNVGVASDTAQAFLASHHRRMMLASYVTDLLCEYGTNDLHSGTGRTTAQVQADLVGIWRAGVRRGLRCWQTTLTPRNTDATGTAVFDAAKEARRVEVNTWLRAGAPVDSVSLAAVAVGTAGALVAGQAGHPLAGVFEVTDPIETARNSGLWKAGMSTDGTHPTTNGHIAMRAGIDTTALLAA